MRYSELYLDDVTECQGDLFVLAVENKYDLIDFIKFYMNSKLRSFIDNGNAYHCTLSGAEIFEYLIKDENLKHNVKKSKVEEDEFMAEWLGCFYSLCQWYLGVDSKYVLKVVEPEEIIFRYNVLHDIDIKLAVKKWCKTKGYSYDLFS